MSLPSESADGKHRMNWRAKRAQSFAAEASDSASLPDFPREDSGARSADLAAPFSAGAAASLTAARAWVEYSTAKRWAGVGDEAATSSGSSTAARDGGEGRRCSGRGTPVRAPPKSPPGLRLLPPTGLPPTGLPPHLLRRSLVGVGAARLGLGPRGRVLRASGGRVKPQGCEPTPEEACSPLAQLGVCSHCI